MMNKRVNDTKSGKRTNNDRSRKTLIGDEVIADCIGTNFDYLASEGYSSKAKGRKTHQLSE
jgi:hypothetical protein